MLKKLTLVVAVLLAGSILGNGQSIYTLTNREIASIPFRFSVGNMVLRRELHVLSQSAKAHCSGAG